MHERFLWCLYRKEGRKEQLMFMVASTPVILDIQQKVNRASAAMLKYPI